MSKSTQPRKKASRRRKSENRGAPEASSPQPEPSRTQRAKAYARSFTAKGLHDYLARIVTADGDRAIAPHGQDGGAVRIENF
jgi:hypothetical protein